MHTCHNEYPENKDAQDCCNYCDKMLSCCTTGKKPVPFLCSSRKYKLPRHTFAQSFEDYQKQKHGVSHDYAWRKEQKTNHISFELWMEAHTLTVCLGYAFDGLHVPCYNGDNQQNMLRKDVWENMYSRASWNRLRESYGLGPVEDGEWEEISAGWPTMEEFEAKYAIVPMRR